jgi:hypothetical protein
MTRLISNITRSSAPASAAGVEVGELECVTWDPSERPSQSRYGTQLYVGSVPSDEDLRCSARGCRAAATVDLQWRNPKLHDTARVKHWLACDEHADHLADFLARRRFLIDRRALD